VVLRDWRGRDVKVLAFRHFVFGMLNLARFERLRHLDPFDIVPKESSAMPQTKQLSEKRREESKEKASTQIHGWYQEQIQMLPMSICEVSPRTNEKIRL
jgi:hypothetical protein